MAAASPLLLAPIVLDDPFQHELTPDLVDPATIAADIAEQNLLLARTADIPESVRLFVEGLADDLAVLPYDATLRTDPYLLVALQKSLLAGLRALEHPDPQVARRELRVRLEQLRQVYRDLADARPVNADRPVKELVRWLVEVLDVPQGTLAELFGVSPRTFQRWVSATDVNEPVGEDARRVRIVANVVGHLRHVLTGQGALEWLERPHPLLGGRAPRDLLHDADALPHLTRLAASTRSSTSA
jgi:putative toxin-antitoxin system antitoxin component (TIGR02293 family)